MNERLEWEIFTILTEFAITVDCDGVYSIVESDFKKVATAIAERLVMDENEMIRIITKVMDKEFTRAGYSEEIAEAIAEAKPIKIK